jgi:DNA (cytosine-5)-methyltransferase 1
MRLGMEALGHRCVMACEIDDDARCCYASNFGHLPKHSDVMQLEERDVIRHDVMCCGFPCNTFSPAGHQECDLSLAMHVVRLAAASTRELVILENTAAFPSVRGGEVMRTLVDALSAAGFPVVHHAVMHAGAITGIPQNRRRWICLAWRSACAPPAYSFPSPLPPGKRQVLRDIMHKRAPKHIACPIFFRFSSRMPRKPTMRTCAVGARTSNGSQNTRVFHALGLGNTLTGSGVVFVWDGWKRNSSGALLLRMLKPDELRRYMGFPPTFKLPPGRVVSTKLLGRAVPPGLIREIARCIRDDRNRPI